MITKRVRTAKRKLGTLIKRLRVETDMSLKKLARDCNVADNVIFRLQCGVGECRPKLVFKVLEVLRKNTQEVVRQVTAYLTVIHTSFRSGSNLREALA